MHHFSSATTYILHMSFHSLVTFSFPILKKPEPMSGWSFECLGHWKLTEVLTPKCDCSWAYEMWEGLN